MGSDIECKQTAQMCKAASDDRSPMAIDFASIDDGNSATEIVKIPVHITEADFIGGARQILDVLRPTWSSENIRFKVGGSYLIYLFNLFMKETSAKMITNVHTFRAESYQETLENHVYWFI